MNFNTINNKKNLEYQKQINTKYWQDQFFVLGILNVVKILMKRFKILLTN